MEEIKNLIDALNKIYFGSKDWFRYEEGAGRYMYIYGQENYLADLFSLLWGKTNYGLSLDKDYKSGYYIIVTKIYD